MKRRIYSVAIPLAPEALRTLLEKKTAWENRELPKGEHRERKVKLRWQDAWTFNLRVNFYSHFDGPIQDIGPTHVWIGKQKEVSVFLSEWFRGTIRPDGMDGSLLEGSFYLSKLSLGILVPTVLLLGSMTFATVIEIFHTGEWPLLLSLFALFYLFVHWAKELSRVYWHSETSPVNQNVLQMLEDWIMSEG